MIFTGNFIIDNVNPLFKGNFNIFDGNVNLGQKATLNNSAINFLENSKDYKENNLVVYITYSKKEAILLKNKFEKKLEEMGKRFNKELDELDIPLKIEDEKINFVNSQSSKFLIFSLGDNSTNSENYYLPKIALSFTEKIIKEKEAIFGNKQKLNVLFCFDNLSGFIINEKKFYESAQLYQVIYLFFIESLQILF